MRGGGGGGGGIGEEDEDDSDDDGMSGSGSGDDGRGSRAVGDDDDDDDDDDEGHGARESIEYEAAVKLQAMVKGHIFRTREMPRLRAAYDAFVLWTLPRVFSLYTEVHGGDGSDDGRVAVAMAVRRIGSALFSLAATTQSRVASGVACRTTVTHLFTRCALDAAELVVDTDSAMRARTRARDEPPPSLYVAPPAYREWLSEGA